MVVPRPSPWNAAETVAGFARSAPNEVLMRFAERERHAGGGRVLADIGCGAGRNAVPLARQRWTVIGTDLSSPMLEAAVKRAHDEAPDGRMLFVQAAMESLPLADASADFVVAHGIWNLAESSAQFRRAVAEAA